MQIEWTESLAKQYLDYYINFIRKESRYTRKLKGKNELLVKAIGAMDKPVLDVTAGLGEDAWTLARLGYQVLACEKNAFLGSCLQKAHAEALKDPDWSAVAQRIQFKQTDSRDYLKQNSSKDYIFYLDPMFDFLSKPTALPRKEMQAMRILLQNAEGPEPEGELLDILLGRPQARVVMKNAKMNVKSKVRPSYQVLGKSVKFDIYLVNANRSEHECF